MFFHTKNYGSAVIDTTYILTNVHNGEQSVTSPVML